MATDNIDVEESTRFERDFVCFPQYYKGVFSRIIRRNKIAIRNALILKPREFRWAHFLSKIPADSWLVGDDAWQLCSEYTDAIETEIRDILRKHSAYFWLHSYRRLGVGIHQEFGGPKNYHSIALVRDIVELAIFKHGSLDRDDDMAPANEVKLEDALGGHLMRLWMKELGDEGKCRELWERFYAKTNQWVLTKFKAEDLIDLYAVEGFAYDYRRTTALMRTVGKGAAFRQGHGNWVDFRPDDEIFRLMELHDSRLNEVPFAASLAGSFFNGFKEVPGFDGKRITMASYNVEKAASPLNVIVEPDVQPADFIFRVKDGTKFLPNFHLSMLDVLSFRDSHAHLEKTFSDSKGYSLNALLGCLWGLSNAVMFPLRSMPLDEEQSIDIMDFSTPLGSNLLNVLQRAYGNFTLNKEVMIKEILWRARDFECNLLDGIGHDEMLLCLDDLILSAESREDKIGLWSGGRRFAVMPFGRKQSIIDLDGIEPILNGLFVRVRDEVGDKGDAFEVAFRNELTRRGFEAVKHGKIKNVSGVKREIDAAVRIGRTLVLFECKAWERPLDMNRGKPSVVRKRLGLFDKKVDQIMSLVDFVRSNKVGRNYDFGWAERVVGFVVSPFVEFIWSFSDRLWESNETPRILSANEAFSMIEKLTAQGE